MYRLAWAAHPPRRARTPLRAMPVLALHQSQWPAQQRVRSPRCSWRSHAWPSPGHPAFDLGVAAAAMGARPEPAEADSCTGVAHLAPRSQGPCTLLVCWEANTSRTDICAPASSSAQALPSACWTPTERDHTTRHGPVRQHEPDTGTQTIQQLALSLEHLATIITRGGLPSSNGMCDLAARPVYRVWFTFADAPFPLDPQGHRRTAQPAAELDMTLPGRDK